MTPEDKIIAAIDRNTEAVNNLRKNVGVPGVWLFLLWAGICVVGCPRAKASPLLPPLDYEIGTPPLPPPNPNIQYWYTMDVPGPDGVLPQEVFAPRLAAANFPIGHPGTLGPTGPVDVPEPGTGLLVGTVVFLIAAGMYASHLLSKTEKKVLRYGLALVHIKYFGDAESRSVAMKALEESK